MTDEVLGQIQAEGHDTDAAFEDFFVTNEPRLRGALVGLFGSDAGRDAAAEAFRHGWEHRASVLAMASPVGYLYQVGRRWGRRQRGRASRRVGLVVVTPASPGFEPKLAAALSTLSPRQRQVVMLINGYGLTHQETADLLGVSRTSIQNHTERGLLKLRQQLGVTP